LIAEKQKELNEWEYIESLNNISEIGIACFSENGMEPLLWSHYTNSYRGFCIKFNLGKLIKSSSEVVKLKRVIYSQYPNVISEMHPFSSFYQYLLKLHNWSYEREWRLLFKNPANVGNRFSFDKNSIEEISVGYKNMDNFTDREKELKVKFDQIRKKRFNEVPLMTVGPHQTKLELNKILLKEGTVEDAMKMLKHKFPFMFK
jgi:hypothetical protein